jgi:ATP-dependent protease ClpP protease subunit
MNYQVWCKKQGTDGELHIYGDIGESWWGEGISAKMVAESLKELKDGNSTNLHVYINSLGGNVFDGMAIYNQIKRWDSGKITVHVDGIAASAASLIAMSGTRIHMGTGSMMMIHEPSSFTIGKSADMREAAVKLEKITEELVDVYTTRTKSPNDKVRQLMRDETWLTSKDAIKEGFADAEESGELKVAATGSASKWFSHYKHVPNSVLAAAQAFPERLKKEEKQMNNADLARILGLSENSTDQVLLSEVSSLLSSTRELLVATGSKTSGEARGVILAWKESADKVASLTTQLATFQAINVEREVTSLVDNAVREGKIAPALKDFWMTEGRKNIEMLRGYVSKAPQMLTPPVNENQPDPAVPTGAIAVTSDDQEKIFTQLGITDPKEKEKIKKQIVEQNAQLARHGIRLANQL